MARFTWHRSGKSSFIAFPEGEGQRDRYCLIAPFLAHGGQFRGWQLTMSYDGRSSTGFSGTRQNAADAANFHWLSFVRQREVEDEAARAEREFADQVEAAVAGRLSIEALSLHTRDRASLLKIMRELKPGPVREAFSVEFYRRRMEADGIAVER